MPEPYFDEPIINKNYAALPVHLQENNDNNQHNIRGNSKLSIPSTSRRQSPTTILDKNSPSLLPQRRSPRSAKLSRTNRYSCLSADLEDDEAADIYPHPTQINIVSSDDYISSPLTHISEPTSIMDISDALATIPSDITTLFSTDVHTHPSSVTTAQPLFTPIPSDPDPISVNTNIFSAPDSDHSTTHQSVNKLTSNTSTHIPSHSLSSNTTIWIPKSISSISKSPSPEKWTFALENEISSLISQKVFDLSDLDISSIDPKLIIPSRVIFDVRMNADGSVNKYKARLVAQGNHQDSSTYFETFADTASARTINILLGIAASENLEISTIDVKTAFLYSPIKETIYLKRPPGLSPNIMPNVVRLNKCIYGLRQAAHEWRNLLDRTIKTIGFIQFKTDECVYKYTHQKSNLIIGVFVDDILCLGTDPEIINWFKEQLSNHFTITIKSSVDSFLGMQISHNISARTISLSQPGYITNLMTRFNIDINSSTSFPTTPMSQLDMQDPLPVPLTPSQQKIYMQIVGSVLFLSTRSRPDLSFSVNYLSLFMTKASQHQLDLCYHLLKYIWYSRDLTLIFNGQSGINFFVMVDSSYASHLDRKSHYGISIHMNNNSGSCVSVSKKSTIIALSSTEAEYVGMFEASKIILWLRQLLLELGFPPTQPTILYEDNKSAIHISENGNDKGRTKHMDVRYHLIRDLIKTQVITIKYMPTDSMIADILTKPVDKKTFRKLQAQLLGNLV
jgi:hypothetical protein